MRNPRPVSSQLLYLKLIPFIFFLVLAVFRLSSQDTIGSKAMPETTYAIDSMIPWHQLIPYAWVFVDSSNQLNISTVSSKNYDQRFQPLSSFLQPGGPNLTYWLKLTLTGTRNIRNWWLLFNNDISNIGNDRHLYIDAWHLDSANQMLEHQQTGLHVPRSKKSIKENPGLNRILFSINKGETYKLYLKIYNGIEVTKLSSIELRNPMLGIPQRNFITEFSILSSVALLFAIISFFLFFFVHEKSYLFFGIYTLLLSQHYLILHPDLPFVDWYVPEYPQLANPAFILLTNGGIVFFILFGRYFINLNELSKKLDNILRGVLLIWVSWILIKVATMVVTYREILPEADFVFIFLFILFIIRIAFFNNILVWYYVAGALWLIVFTILGILWNNSVVVLPFNPWPVGQLGQLLIYTAGLAYKIKMNEKARTQAELIKLRNLELAGLYADSEKQKKEIEIQKMNTEKSLEDLKNTQAQLIQSEKMASLGELTAGIAHEIQNPLNFVNNFSEVNNELIGELEEERVKPRDTRNEHIENGLFIQIKENLTKINQHGKRADAIVKGMLQHSQKSIGVKELININSLAEEYLRLTYHSFQSKHEGFSCQLKLDLDSQLPLLNVIPQDIGRVLLNLYNNAFWACAERSLGAVNERNVEVEKLKSGEVYDPTASVSTKKVGDKVEIKVTDNGNGIPQIIVDKIFQPFFTTKPTGQGTGLGLSLSYDIIKAHGGEIKVETKEGEGTTFIIQLPALA